MGIRFNIFDTVRSKVYIHSKWLKYLIEDAKTKIEIYSCDSEGPEG